MKTLNKILLHLVIVSVLSAFILSRGYRAGEQACNESWLAVIDSMKAIAELPPDTLVVHDTIWPPNDTIVIYKDLLVAAQLARVSLIEV